jgi:endonuclease/exonuclease/phosphatase family metal-dependent hydrolase
MTLIETVDYSTAAESTFFSNSHGTFTKVDHALVHKIHLKKFRRVEIRQHLVSDHSGIKLEISNRKIAGKSQLCP